ncbi:MAG: aminotransferase class I/II-fold pyridoxal phosphate-dependent enzyme [Clostridia bacterium]|nr:aminotransferase class I/II-fold pyridoxal phosphate-dependent enzyme [Clostridia bacterium]
MQAIILAAGMGSRLKELTKNNTKCMVKVNGVTLIDRMLHQIEKNKIDRIIIVVGYKGKILKEYINSLDIKIPITFVENPIYNKTNNIYSLYLAREYLTKDDTLLFESDLIFEDNLITMLIDDPRPTLALVDKYEAWMDGTCVKLDKNSNIDAFVPGSKFKYDEIDEYYKTINIYKFSKNFSETHYVPFLEAYSKALGNNEYYEQVLKVITMLDDSELKAKKINGEKWYEIDDVQDLDIAETIFIEDKDKKVELFKERYGGYWRYPKLLDFCYLVNPYFPPKKMINEIKSSFENLITQYPSGMKVNSLLAAKNFNIHQENIVVGNGAAELIKSLMNKFDGKMGIIKPTFEEYNHRYDEKEIIVYSPENENYEYSAKDLIEYYDNKNIKNLILINPDNPSGNYINKKGLLELIKWSSKNNIRLLIDESFVDFADEDEATIINQEIIEKNNNLFVIKSISKSYGVPGLRLGILVSGNKEIIDYVKKDVSIWNINSFGEFYLQIAEKYKKDYKKALEKFKVERNRFINELSNFKAIRIIPTQANYIMAEIVNGVTAKELNMELLDRYNILIKDLTEKIKDNDRQYVRIAIRNTEDNNKLIKGLENILNK